LIGQEATVGGPGPSVPFEGFSAPTPFSNDVRLSEGV